MNLFIYGAGGLGKEVYDCVTRVNSRSKQYDQICFVQDEKYMTPGVTTYYGAALLSYERAKLSDKNKYVFSIAIGEPDIRARLFTKIKDDGFNFATIIDPNAIVSPTAKIQEGVFVGANAFVSSDTYIGSNVLLQPNCVIAHDSKVLCNCVISSFVSVAGNVTINNNSYIAIGVPIREGVAIGSETIVGMGSIVTQDIGDGVIAKGEPAAKVKENHLKRVFKNRNANEQKS